MKQMVNRVKFVLALLGSPNQSVSTFGDQYLTIDFDEKWFYVVPIKRKIRMYPEDEYPGDNTGILSRRLCFLQLLANRIRCPTEFMLMADLVSGPLVRMLKLLEGPKIVIVALWKSEV